MAQLPTIASQLSIKLCRRLIKAGFKLPDGETGYAVVRTYAGHWQRSTGACVWHLWPLMRDITVSCHIDVIGQSTVTQLLKAKSITIAPDSVRHSQTWWVDIGLPDAGDIILDRSGMKVKEVIWKDRKWQELIYSDFLPAPQMTSFKITSNVMQ